MNPLNQIQVGGCSQPSRGWAAEKREKMKDENENNKQKFIDLSSMVHCKVYDDSCGKFKKNSKKY